MAKVIARNNSIMSNQVLTFFNASSLSSTNLVLLMNSRFVFCKQQAD